MRTRRSQSVDANPDFLHGIFRSRSGELYHAKRESFVRLLAANDSTLHELISRAFGEDRFPGTELAKATVIAELLHDRLSFASWRLIRERLRSQPHLTDRRHTEEYAFDVALGWLTEEFVVAQLRAGLPDDVTVALDGVDRDRDFLSKRILANPDILLTTSTQRRSLELFVDHRGSWRKNKGMDLKKGKIAHLRSGDTDFILGLDLDAGRFHLIGPAAVTGIVMTANAAMGVETGRVPVDEGMSIDETMRAISKELGVRAQRGGAKRR